VAGGARRRPVGAVAGDPQGGPWEGWRIGGAPRSPTEAAAGCFTGARRWGGRLLAGGRRVETARMGGWGAAAGGQILRERASIGREIWRSGTIRQRREAIFIKSQ